MMINAANLLAMFTAYSLVFQSGYGEAEIFYRDIATIVPSATESMTYAWMEKIPKGREWIGPKTIQNVVARGPRVVVNKPYEETVGVDKHKIQDDTYGIYSPMVQMLGMQAAKWPDDVLFDNVLTVNGGRGPVAFDGVPYFATNHPIDLEDSSKGTYSNVQTGFALNLTNYGIAKKTMRTYKGADGRTMGMRGNLLVVPPSLEETARTLLNTQYYPKLADGGSLGSGDVGQIENIWRGSAELLVIDELEEHPTHWMLLDTRKPIKPFLFQLREAPAFTYLTNPSDPNVFFLRQFLMGWEARGMADVTLPFLGFRGEG